MLIGMTQTTKRKTEMNAIYTPRKELFMLYAAVVVMTAVAIYSAYRFSKAREAAYYWQQQYINVSFTSMAHSNAIPK